MAGAEDMEVEGGRREVRAGMGAGVEDVPEGQYASWTNLSGETKNKTRSRKKGSRARMEIQAVKS